MEELRRIISANIQRLRLRSGYTQQELAAELNYTDKAVSKWERGESVPDVSVLLKIVRLFGVTLDYLVTDHDAEGREATAAVLEDEPEEVRLVPSKQAETPQESAPVISPAAGQSKINNLADYFGYKPNLFTIALMSAASVWMIAVVTYVVLSIFVPSFTKTWMCFVFAVPATFIVLLIFNLLWGKMEYSFTLMSALLWSALASVFIFFLDKGQNWVLFLIGVPAQILLILWSKLYKKHR